ncbi:MAG TPA: adenosine kinase [Acidimicrobiales bacterium]
MSDGAPDQLLDVVAVGSSLVDVLVQVDDARLAAVGLAKGSMELVDLARAEDLYAGAGPGVEVSGGSAANTAVGVACLGGSAGFVGKVADDPLGTLFAHDIRASGVQFDPPTPVASRPGADLGTGRCLVFVSPDAERTMATHLGVAVTLAPDDVPLELVSRARLLYLEGYLWDLAPAKEAMRRAIGAAHRGEGAVALSLSDPFCVDRHRREFLDLLLDEVDVLFGNEEEIVSLFGARSLDAALEAAEETGLLVAVTRGAAGAVVVTERGPLSVPATPVDHVVDTTGAGDLFAAGFLYALARGAEPEQAARLGALCAAEVVGHIGARPQADLRALALASGLLEGLISAEA